VTFVPLTDNGAGELAALPIPAMRPAAFLRFSTMSEAVSSINEKTAFWISF
jgi:hypothetical protein